MPKKSLGLNSSDKIIGTVGRLCSEKNYQMLIRSFVIVKRGIKEAKLVIIGDGELKDNLVALADSLGLGGDILFLGAREDVGDIIKIFDIKYVEKNELA